MTKKPVCLWWPYLVAFLLVAVMLSILLGGVKSFLYYKSSAAPQLVFDLDLLHFFTKDYLQRRYAGLTTNKLPVTTELPSFRLYADDQDLESLNSNLPTSGKVRYIQGHIKIDSPSIESGIQFRYRGGLPLHWLYKKKSFRVKLPPYTTYRGERKFNLVNPSEASTVTDMVSYGISRSIGLLTPDYFPSRVYVNNKYNGMHFFLSQVDESFLRKNKRMPGSIYSGDTLYVPNPFGKNKAVTELIFTQDGSSLLWNDERLWQKDASRNAESINDRSDIKRFIEISNETDRIKFLDDFETYFDKEKYYLFWGLDTLFGSHHHDNFHNHKVYFDPYKGKFEPIEWDIRYWSSFYRPKDLIEVPLLRQVKLNPVLELERDRLAYELFKKYTVENIVGRIEAAKDEVKDELSADPYRQYYDHNTARPEFNKEVYLSMEKFQNDVENLKKTYRQRYSLLGEVYERSLAEYTLNKSGANDVLLTISISGNSPVNFDPWAIVPSSLHSKIDIVRTYIKELSSIPKGAQFILYPGRKIIGSNSVMRTDTWTLMAFGKERLAESPVHYQFIIKNIDLSDLENMDEIIVTNSITDRKVPISPVEKLSSDHETASIHPWILQLNRQIIPAEIILSGEIDILNDRVYEKNQRVKIQPGTIFKLAKGRSLVFYGKVLAAGTKINPVKFLPLVDGEPWGSVVIQGKAASGSILSHIQVAGGSVTEQRLISYPGQLNIHDVDSFIIDNCLISNNNFGDDALHVAYSKGSISNCQFKNTAFDALDIDISEVAVTNTNFLNIGNDAIDVMTSVIKINDVKIDGAGDKCFSIGEESDVIIKESQLYNCQIGIAVKDQSKAYVENLEFLDNKESAIALYRKNSRYSAGGLIDGTQLHGITKDDIYLGEHSVSRIRPDAFLPVKNMMP